MHMLKRFAVTLVGAAVTVLGILLMPLPGPGILVVVVGLTILATEYAWARRLLVTAKDRAAQAQAASTSSPLATAATVVFALGLLGLGVAMIAGVDLPFASTTAGAGLVLGGVILLTTTVLSLRHKKGVEQTYTPEGLPLGHGSVRVTDR